MKHRIALMIAALLCAVLFFGCANNTAPKEPPAEIPTATTTTLPVEPSDPNNPLIGKWVTQEGGFCCREHRGFALFEFNEDNTGWQHCGYNSFAFTWQLTDNELIFAASFIDDTYSISMELDGNSLRLDGILFTRYR